MADNKSTIVVYSDWITLFESLTDDEAGKLIKHFFRYVNDLNPKAPDRLTEISFIPIKQSLKRDLKKWETTLEGRSKAGKASAEARRIAKEQELTNSTSVENVEQNSTNPTDSVTDSVTVTDILLEKETKENISSFSFDEFWELYPNKVGKAKCKPKYEKLKDSEKEQIKNTLNDFIKYKPFESYSHPNPETYINQKRWEDEIKKEVSENEDINWEKFIDVWNSVFWFKEITIVQESVKKRYYEIIKSGYTQQCILQAFLNAKRDESIREKISPFFFTIPENIEKYQKYKPLGL